MTEKPKLSKEEKDRRKEETKNIIKSLTLKINDSLQIIHAHIKSSQKKTSKKYIKFLTTSLANLQEIIKDKIFFQYKKSQRREIEGYKRSSDFYKHSGMSEIFENAKDKLTKEQKKILAGIENPQQNKNKRNTMVLNNLKKNKEIMIEMNKEWLEYRATRDEAIQNLLNDEYKYHLSVEDEIAVEPKEEIVTTKPTKKRTRKQPPKEKKTPVKKRAPRKNKKEQKVLKEVETKKITIEEDSEIEESGSESDGVENIM